MGSDLMIMEKTARGKKDIVLGYVLGLGTPGMLKMGECYGNAMCTETCLATFDDADCTLTGMMYGFVLITKEHRSLLETAYAYGSKHQFVLITGGPVLKYLG